ncbi:MAG TPA: hypothetical protein VGN32_10315 [Ktedonobacterales bacterium]|nr:hypothetical protein [Ktedonobacterales bacterium]
MHGRQIKVIAVALSSIMALVMSSVGAGSAFAHPAAAASIPVSAHAAGSQTIASHTANISALPTATASQLAVGRRQLPAMTGRSASAFAAAKANATHNKNAPNVRPTATPVASAPASSATGGFQGMADSATICPYFGGCQPPDMALATSPHFVLQGVNTSYAVYTTSGTLVHGPINDQAWYGVPNPPNNCDPAGPFLSDPRAFYDPNSGLFWTATLQVESAAFGVGVNCPNQSTYWIANLNVSTGVMHVYAFDMTLGGTVNAGADYTQFGFSKNVISFTGNMFDFTTGNYDFAEALFADKHRMEKGLSVTANAFTMLTVGSVLVDTVQPVETETTPLHDPGVEYLVNSFNMNGDPFGDDCLFTACHGFTVWAYDPSANALTGTLADNTFSPPADNYVVPPNADQPTCTQCVETIDTRITGTPVYSVGAGGNGLISFSVNTGANNNISHTVPSILWGQIQPALSGGTIFFAGIYQAGYLVFAGDQDASFGAMMQDNHGRLVMVFDTMSASLNPSIMVTQRLASDALGSLRAPRFVFKGTVATFDSRWGDFEAASYDGFSTNHIWVASQYSIGDWATFIERV